MAMFSFSVTDLIDPDYEDMKNKLLGMRPINIELDWNNNRIDAFLRVVAGELFRKYQLNASRWFWEKVPGTQSYDDVRFTVICDGFDLCAQFPIGVLFHPDCPHSLPSDVADGMKSKYDNMLKQGK